MRFPLILLALVSVGALSTVEHEVRFSNPGEVAYTAIETQWGTYPVDCQPGATCSVVVSVPWGQYEAVTIKAVAGTEKSASSNSLDRTVYPSDAERADFDQSKTVTVLDFGRFLRQLGSSW
jgi:hypothetical protein